MHFCSRPTFDDVMRINFLSRLLVICHLVMAVIHLSTKFCANSFIQFGVIDVFRNPRWRRPSSWIFKLCEWIWHIPACTVRQHFALAVAGTIRMWPFTVLVVVLVVLITACIIVVTWCVRRRQVALHSFLLSLYMLNSRYSLWCDI